MSMATGQSATPPADRIRLHISPFNAEIYSRIIPPSLQSLAGNHTFHSIQTFPEKDYGFIELPTMEAQKLKKKLNGSTLKGTKMSIEEARPVKKRKSSFERDEVEKASRKRVKATKKANEEHSVLNGHEIEDGRRVKRGWTGDDAKDAKGKKLRKEKPASDSKERKLRFRTKLPPNKEPVQNEHEKKKKDKKKQKNEKGDQNVVEEFSKRKKMRHDSGIVNGPMPGSTSFVEGTGWVDEAGEVVDPQRQTRRSRRKSSPDHDIQTASTTLQTSAGAGMEPSRDSQRDDTPPSAAQASSVSSGDSEGAEEDSKPPPESSNPSVKEIHPLEALFKRSAAPSDNALSKSTPSKPRPAPIDTSFSFFGAADAGDDDEDTEMADGDAAGVLPPVTPHTKQDLEWRSLRSAAPTPDTAAIGRKMSFPFASQNEHDDDEDEDEDEGEHDLHDQGNYIGAGGQVKGDEGGNEGRGEESAFRKWFFENRGDLNRGWKKRRREERKVKRQRENRRLGSKIA